MLKVINLGKLGVEYFKDNYKSYINYVKLLREYNVEIKNVYTFLPDESSKLNSIDKFRYGITETNIQLFGTMKEMFPEINNSTQMLRAIFSELIESYIKIDERNTLYINEFESTSNTIESDRKKCKTKVKWKDNYIKLDAQVVYYIQGENLNKHEVYDTLGYAQAMWLPYDIGFVSNYFPSTQNANSEEVKKIIQGIKLVFIGAYDGEGILIGEIKEGTFIEAFDKLDIPYIVEHL